ncbi:MAG: YCF48-related protein, partial [Actinomycetota bacterium]
GSGYTSAPTVTFGGNTGPAQYLQAVQMTSSTVGYAVGSTGAIFKTTDGGATWLPQTSNTTATLRGLYFTDSSNGFAVGQSYTSEQGFILRTTDGGATWAVNSATTINNRLRGIAITDSGSTLVITSEDGAVLRRNSANNWTDGIDTVAAGLASVSSGTTSDLSPVNFAPSSTTGYIGGAAGMILKTTDSGASLAVKAGGDDQTLHSTSFINATTGWIAGSGGTVKKTIDGGATWSNDNSGMPSDVEIHNIHFISATEGFAVGCQSTGCRQDGITSVAGTATVSGGVVTGVTNIYSSSGWATAPTVSFSGGGGTDATGTATISGGAVTGVTITNGGSGYTSAPTVTFSGGGSTGVAYKYSSGTWTAMSISGSVASL